MRKVAIVAASLCLLGALSPAPDKERAPGAYISAADGGRFYVKMVPDKERVGVATVYRVTDAADEVVWSVSGWYAFSTFLSDDGQFLVRMGNWPRGREPSDEDLAVAFYKSGELLAQYSTKALIQHPDLVPRSVSHYDYILDGAPIGFVRTPTDGVWPLHWFQFVTSDRIQHTFDRRTGAIVKEEPYAD